MFGAKVIDDPSLTWFAEQLDHFGVELSDLSGLGFVGSFIDLLLLVLGFQASAVVLDGSAVLAEVLFDFLTVVKAKFFAGHES